MWKGRVKFGDGFDFYFAVIPAKAGIQLTFFGTKMDSGFRRNDELRVVH